MDSSGAASEGENPKRDESPGKNDDGDTVGNSNNSKIVNSNEGQGKPKRQMKTPFQLEALEKAYAMETYPSESIRVELSEKLGLTDRQLQMWFCHRRLKDKKDLPSKKQKKTPAALPDSPVDDLRLGPYLGTDYGSGSASGSSAFGRTGISRGLAGYYESPQSLLELRAIACVEAQLGEPMREDGPILGIEFDPLPPDAFGTPLEQQQRPGLAYGGKLFDRLDVKPNKTSGQALQEYQFFQNPSNVMPDTYGPIVPPLRDPIMDGPSARTPSLMVDNDLLPRVHTVQGHSSRDRILSQQNKQAIRYPSPPREDDYPAQRDSLTITNMGMNSHFSDRPVVKSEPYAVPSGHFYNNDAMPRMDRKRKSEDTRTAREVEVHEIRMGKELEKQDILRRKNEERMRKEIERQDRERRKEEERLMREKQREEERAKREQKREMERREKNLLKENLRAEKRRQKEELRKEKEAERRKIALEKATARRLAKESMELIEDEQLELMELAATSKGVASIIHLNLEALQNLESFRGSLTLFPPRGVKLKKPFTIQPWVNCEENIGNLLMVWRFLITFSDVLGLWPFTLDEFIQAFHDYDSRLLGEIHVALLKVIIKDIEDIARTPTGIGANQNGAANSGGGHPEIIEGAYAWGFDIRNWQQHLNPLTWPEVFRQLALSAGFGPKLRRRNIVWQYPQEKDEGQDCEAVISTLRSGSAAEKAVAKMQERGLLAPRRSRHRLTPGTVKFAAFHVLSLEGSKGLTVLELAEKIQKSGLRDLTTSKTPEASISVALTRDTKLFERIAPSTYRVRAAYRKDPADAEAILSEARKKIQIFANGSLPAEDVDDVERDEESESDDIDEDAEVDELVTATDENKTTEQYEDMNPCSSNGKENLSNEIELNLHNEFDKETSFAENGPKSVDCQNEIIEPPVVGDVLEDNTNQNDLEIDESKSGESWIQGLTEGDYPDLSVEERLNALVALVGVANEGNSIRVVLEDRLEAANALKKQMWAEAQLDKKCTKDDIVNKSDVPFFVGNRVETQYNYLVVEGSQSPLPDINNKTDDESPSAIENQKLLSTPLNGQNQLSSTPSEKPAVPFINIGSDNFQIQQLEYASKRSRSQLKSYIAQRAEEMYIYRSLPLGQDRRRNRYWQFVASASRNDPGAGRIFVELQDGNWRLIDSEEAFDALLMSLDARGIRESHLRLMLQNIECTFKENVRSSSESSKFFAIEGASVKNEADEMDCSPDYCVNFDSPSSTLCGSSSDALESSSSFKIKIGRYNIEKKASMRRYQEFQRWMWKECYNSSSLYAMKYGKKRGRLLVDICDVCLNSYYFESSHCPSCHQTTSITGFNSSQHSCQCAEKPDTRDICISYASLPLQIRLVKSIMANIEVSIPPEALHSLWKEDYRKQWGKKLSMSSSAEELLKMLTLLERALRRESFSPNFSTTEELLGPANMSLSAVEGSTDLESVSVLPWLPQTTAALALRMLEFDASISYTQLEKCDPCETKEAKEYIKLPSRYVPTKTATDAEPGYRYDEYKPEDIRMEFKSGRNIHKRGHHEQGRGRKHSKKMHDSKSDISLRNVKVNENFNQGLKQQVRGINAQSGGRGRRTVRKRRVEKRGVEDLLLGQTTATPVSKSETEPTGNLVEEWDDDRAVSTPIELRDTCNSAEEVESDDNGQAVEYEQGNWEIGFNGASSRWCRGLMEASEEDVDASEDYNVIEDGVEEDYVADAMSEDSDEMAARGGADNGSESAVSEDSCD